MSQTRVITKSANRRLYDNVQSRYITLEDVRQLVREGIDFVIIDKKTKGEITCSVLLQVIAEQERHEQPLLGHDVLLQMIRSYGDPMRASLSRYLEESLGYLTLNDKHDATIGPALVR